MATVANIDSHAIRRIAGAGVTAIVSRSSRTFVRHTHDEYGFGVIVRGAQRSWSGRGKVEAGAGDVITVNPGEVHDGAPIGAGRAWSMLYVAPERMRALLRDIRDGDAALREFHQPVVRAPAMARRFCALFRAATAGEPAAFEERLLSLVAELVGDAAAVRGVPGALARVRQRIDDDPGGDHPLAALAACAGMSRFQVLRGFRHLTGLTPGAYVIQRRLDLARSLIRGGTPLAHAAGSAGFVDQSHLHRAFTRRYGLTPGTFASAMR